MSDAKRKTSIFTSFKNGYESIVSNPDIATKLDNVKSYFEGMEFTVQFLGFLVGLSYTFLGAMGILSSTFGFSPISLLLSGFMCLFGITMCLLEFKNQLMIEKYRSFIERELHILYTPYGRGGFYILAGTFVLAAGGFMNFCVGAFSIAVGGFAVISAKQAQDALGKLLDDQYTESEIRSHFNKFDKDRSGALDSKEMKELYQDLLSTTLTDAQLDAAIFAMDKNHNGMIEREEFLDWWRETKDKKNCFEGLPF
jgi:calmodulin